MKKKRCAHKRVIGRMVQYQILPPGLPQLCQRCGKVFALELPKAIKGPSGDAIYLCPDCLSRLRCDGCGRAFELKDGFVGECLTCSSVVFFCQRCARKKLYINLSASPDPEEIVRKLYAIVEELVDIGRNKTNKWSLLNLFRKKKKGGSKPPFPLIMNINMYFNDDAIDFYEEGFEEEE